MTNQIEKDYDTLVEEMMSKIEQAIKLLNEAKEAATKAGVNPLSYDDWYDLREAIGGILQAETAWDNSSWCGDSSWNDSGCSY